MDKHNYIVAAIDANILVLCNKHLEAHGCRSKDILQDIQNILHYAGPAGQECLEKVTSTLLDLILEKELSRTDYEIVDTINSIINTACSLEKVLSEFITATGGSPVLSKLSIFSHSVLKLRPRDSKTKSIQYVKKKYLDTVKQCTKSREIREEIPETIKCHEIMRLAKCMKKHRNTQYAPKKLYLIYCTRRIENTTEDTDCEPLCEPGKGSISIVYCK